MEVVVETSAEPEFDKRDQYERVREGLLPGESIVAVYDCIGAGTGFVGLTDRRVILQDNSFMGKKAALTSVPYGRIHSVSFLSNKSFLGKVPHRARSRSSSGATSTSASSGAMRRRGSCTT
jgi:hypothetical protein